MDEKRWGQGVGRGAVGLTNSGGPGILAADALEALGLDVMELSASTVAKLAPLFPAEASLRNPLDMIASATPAGYRAALEALLADDGVDSVLAIVVPPLGVRQEDVAEAIVAATRAAPEKKPVLAVLMGRQGLPQGRQELHDAGTPAYIFPESAARALAAMVKYQQWLARPVDDDAPLAVDRARATAIIASARATERLKLSETDALALLEAYGVPTAPARLARDEDEAARFARELGPEVVLKFVSPTSCIRATPVA